MSRFEHLLNRLRRLEPAPSKPSPWPPTEGSFSYLLWDGLGRPGERQGFMSMYMETARRFWEERK